MAKRITLGQIGGYSEDKLDQLMRVVVLETDTVLKSESPVDTGRFRASWAIGEGITGSYDAGPGPHGVVSQVGLNYQPGTETFGKNYHVHNSLIYAEPLANGHSPQAPAGWVDIVAKKMTRRAQQLGDIIGRQD